MVNKDKKVIVNEGREITNGKLSFGGFPRIIKENGVVSQFNDSDDKPGSGDEKIATHQDESEPITWKFTHKGQDYPSQTMVDFQKSLDEIGGKLKAAHETFKSKYGPVHYEKHMMADPAASALVKEWQSVGDAMRAHPHHAELVKGHPSKRRELSSSELDRLYRGD